MLKQIALATTLVATFGVAHAYQAEIKQKFTNTSFDGDKGFRILLASAVNIT